MNTSIRFGAMTAVTAVLLSLAHGGAFARTWNVYPDGSGDAATIPAAVQGAASGDEVLVHPGTYMIGEAIDPAGKELLIRSSDGPEVTTVTKTDDSQNRLFWFHTGEGPGTVVEGLLLKDNREAPTPGEGDCMIIEDASPLIRNCTIREFFAPIGGAVYCSGAETQAEFDDCVFYGNGAVTGGALAIALNARVTFLRCEFRSNDGQWRGGAVTVSNASEARLDCCLLRANHNATGSDANGAAVFVEPGATCTITRCTVVSNVSFGDRQSAIYVMGNCTIETTQLVLNFGSGVQCTGTTTVACSDVWGNHQGEMQGVIDGGGNFSADPLYCGPTNNIHEDSPCAPGHHPSGSETCGLVGCGDVGCGTDTPTLITTWGSIKAVYK